MLATSTVIMKLYKGLTLPLEQLKSALKHALIPTLKTLIRNPSSIFTLSRVFMAHLWAAFGPPQDRFRYAHKEALLKPNARGVVVDLGAGLGHTAKYLDRTKVTKYIAVEPNTYMHPSLREAAAEAGFYESDGTFVLLSCGAEDTLSILDAAAASASSTSASGGTNLYTVSTIISILTICSIPNAQSAITSLVRDALKPGGELLFFEHVRSEREDVAWWQWAWTPIWGWFFDGCRLDCPTDRWIEGMKGQDVRGTGTDGREEVVGMWKEGKVWKPEDEDENGEYLIYHRYGRFVKA